jgi:hypothetical protein
MSDCARCRQPLLDEGRWNATYGGPSHHACRDRAVWPPLGGIKEFQYNPLIALRKMATREAFAGQEAQVHIQALMAIVGTQFPMPRPRPRRDSLPPEHDRAPRQLNASSSQSSSTAPLALTKPSVDLLVPERKRRQPPRSTPKDTPSPPAKKSAELPATAQASKHQQPTTSNTTTTPRPRKASQPAANVIATQPEREYKLQKAVLAAGGKFVVQDSNNEHKQYRRIFDGREDQYTQKGVCLQCHMRITNWGDCLDPTLCQICGKRRKRGKEEDTLLSVWTCDEHEIDACFSCIPVVLRTPLNEE